MREREMERLFERVGKDGRPGAEFEEDLLLRLEAQLAEGDAGEAIATSTLRRSSDRTAMIEFDRSAEPRQPAHQPFHRMLAAAAVVVVLLGIAGLTVAVREPAKDSPVITAPLTVPITPPPSLVSSVDALCARHLDVLERIDELGSPLSNTMVPPEDDQRVALLNELIVVVDDYLATLTAAASVEQSILDDVAEIAADLVTEVAFANRGRLDGALVAIPEAADRLLAINDELGGVGASCG